jgi:subtilisin family serine protease
MTQQYRGKSVALFLGAVLPAFRKLASQSVLHRCRRAFALLLTGVVVSVLLDSAPSVAQAPRAPQAAPPIANTGAVRFVRGRLLVQPRRGLSEQQLDGILQAQGGRRLRHIPQINVYIVELPPSASEQAVANALRRSIHLKFAELDRVFEPSQAPNDPYYGNAWHLPKIGAPTAWDTSIGQGVTIAVLDSGVDAAHPDLAPQMVPGWNFYDNNSNTTDVYGHGTAVAGVAAAAGNNASGVTAVTWRSKVMPIRVTDAQGYGYTSMMAQGLVWAADRGARVANISFLGVAADSTILNAAQYMRNKGGVVVVAGGNTGGALNYAPSDLVTAVAATDSNDARTSWSSYGNYIDIAAPGVGIWTTTRGGGYGGFSGTSASSPVVAGTYALMISANPSLKPAGLDTNLFSTARDLGSAGFDTQYGHGRVDAAAAVAKSAQSPAPDTQPPTVTISAPTNGAQVSGLVPVNVSVTDNGDVPRVELLVDGSVILTDTAPPYAFTWDVSSRADGPATLQARAYDAAGNVGDSAAVDVTVTNDLIKPTVAFVSPTNGSVVTGTVTVSVTASDNNKVAKISLTIDGKEVKVSYGSSLSYSWNTGGKGKGGGGKTTNGGGKSGKSGKNGRSAVAGTNSSLVARAEDASGNSAMASISVIRQ